MVPKLHILSENGILNFVFLITKMHILAPKPVLTYIVRAILHVSALAVGLRDDMGTEQKT